MGAFFCMTLNNGFDAVAPACARISETHVPALMLCSLISLMYVFALECIELSEHVGVYIYVFTRLR